MNDGRECTYVGYTYKASSYLFDRLRPTDDQFYAKNHRVFDLLQQRNIVTTTCKVHITKTETLLNA